MKTKMFLLIPILLLSLFVIPSAFAQTYSAVLNNNSDFSQVRDDNASLPKAWFFDDGGQLLPSYPPMIDRGTWNLNSYILNNGLEISSTSNNEYIRSDIFQFNNITNSTRTVNLSIEFDSVLSSDTIYFYIYNSPDIDPEHDYDSVIQLSADFSDTLTCTFTGSEGNIIIQYCNKTHVGNNWKLTTIYTIDSSFSSLFSLQIVGFPSSTPNFVDNITIKNITVTELLNESVPSPPIITGQFTAQTSSLLAVFPFLFILFILGIILKKYQEGNFTFKEIASLFGLLLIGIILMIVLVGLST